MLVSVHGAGAANALFMRPGSSLLEVRPYQLESGDPCHIDWYFANQLRRGGDEVRRQWQSTGCMCCVICGEMVRSVGDEVRKQYCTIAKWHGFELRKESCRLRVGVMLVVILSGLRFTVDAFLRQHLVCSCSNPAASHLL